MTLLERLRRDRLMSDVDFARATGYKPGYVMDIEMGGIKPPSAVLEKFAETLDWSGDPAALLGEVDVYSDGERRPLRAYTIVHRAGFDSPDAIGGIEEEICMVLAPSAERALSTWCGAHNVHPETFESIGGRIWHEWYEAEEVGA